MELEPREQRTRDRFEELMDEGHSLIEAARLALQEAQDRDLPGRRTFRRPFVEWLSEDTVLITHGGKVMLSGKGRSIVGSGN